MDLDEFKWFDMIKFDRLWKDLLEISKSHKSLQNKMTS